jgi:hypothetical protein
MQPNPIQVLQNGGGPEQQHAFAHHRLRLYQVFVNVEGLEVKIKQPLLGFIPRTKKKEYGFYAVMMLAAPEESMPPLLLSLAKEALADEFKSLSLTTPEEWSIEQVEWRETGMAPPMFQQPGCVDEDWGAAWYELRDEEAKKHRYRLAKSRLWKGRRKKRKLVAS